MLGIFYIIVLFCKYDNTRPLCCVHNEKERGALSACIFFYGLPSTHYHTPRLWIKGGECTSRGPKVCVNTGAQRCVVCLHSRLRAPKGA